MHRPTAPSSQQRRSPATIEEKVPDQILIGQRLLKAGLLSQSQIAQALREKKVNHLKVGEVCLEHGWITPEHLYALLPSTRLSIGELLILRGDLTFEQLKAALAHQRQSTDAEIKLGELLAQWGWIDGETLAEALEQQTQIRELSYLDAWQALQMVQVQIQLGQESLDPEAAESGSEPQAAAPQRRTQPESLRIPSHLHKQPGLTDKPHRPDLLDPVSEPDTAPSQATAADLSRQTTPVEMPVNGAKHEAKYQSRIASLELQMDMQEREWQALTEQMNQQVAEFHARYQERIAELERQLHQHQQEQLPTLQQLQVYQDRVQSLEAEIASHQAQHRTDQTQILTLQAQVQQLERDLQDSQDQRQKEQAALHQHYQRQLQETEALLQQQQQQAESQQTELQARLSRAKQCIDNLTLELAESYTTQDQAQHQLKQQIEQLTEALAQAQQHPPEPPPSSELQIQLQDAHQLIKVYQQDLESTQQQLQAQQTQNRWLAAKLIHLQESTSGAQLDLEAAPSSTPQPQPLLAQLQQAALITEAQSHEMLDRWTQQGGAIDSLLWEYTGLSEATVHFFQAQLEGQEDLPPPRHLPQLLLAADLITEADLQMIRRLYPNLPHEQLGEALAEQGVIRPGTARYFSEWLKRGGMAGAQP